MCLAVKMIGNRCETQPFPLNGVSPYTWGDWNQHGSMRAHADTPTHAQPLSQPAHKHYPHMHAHLMHIPIPHLHTNTSPTCTHTHMHSPIPCEAPFDSSLHEFDLEAFRMLYFLQLLHFASKLYKLLFFSPH